MNRVEQNNPDRSTLFVSRLDNYGEAIDIMERRKKTGQSQLGEASLNIESRYEPWSGSKDLDSAIEVAKYGWPEGSERINQALANVAIDELVGSRSDLQLENEYAGDEVDIDRYLSNDPENMLSYHLALSEKGKIINLYLNCSQSAYVSTEAIINRGVAVLNAHQILVQQGYSVGLTMVEATSSRAENAVLETYIPVVEPGNFITNDTLAFAIAHPSFLRRLVFAVQETESTNVRYRFDIARGGGYGLPSKIQSTFEGPHLLIDKDDGMELYNADDVAAYTKKLVDKAAKELE